MEGDPTPPVAAPPAANTKASDKKVESLLQTFIKILLTPIDKHLLLVAPELGHLSPVIFTIGTLFIALVTLNYPIFLFSLAAGEATLLHSVLSSTSSYFVNPDLGTMSDSSREAPECKSYFQSMTPMRFQGFLKKGISNTFPSTSMYYISFAAAYCLQSIAIFSEECSELGPSYSNRSYLALMGSIMFIILYALYLRSYGCESVLTILFSVFIGVIVGSFLCYQNYALFGKEGVGILYIPPLVKRSGMDYICVSTS